MSLTHSTKIVTDGLVFAYDMANTKKSWKGAPTTNLLTNPDNFSLWSKTANSGTIASISTDITLSPDQSKLAEKLTLPNDGTYPRIYQYWTPASTALHTYSIWLKAASTPCTCQLYVFRNSPWNTSGTYTANITSEWTRFSYSFSPLDTTLHYVYIGSHDSAKGSIFYLSQAQMEISTIPTPFVNGTRPSSLYNLVTGQTPTVQTWNLTYSENGTFSFSGSGVSSRVSMGDFSIGSWPLAYGVSPNNYTVEVIFKPSSVSNYQNVFDGSGSGNYGPRLEMNSSGNLVWIIGNSVGAGSQYTAYTVVSSGLQSNVYHHVILTVANNTVKTYYNSSLVTSTALVYANDGNSLQFPILGRGFSTSAERWFVGEIPMFRVYNRSISASEVKQNFNAQRGRYGL